MPEKIEKFEDFTVWQSSVELCIRVYKQLANCKDYGLRDQIQRSSVSIPSNIAEGFERKSNKEFIQYLYYSKGSCAELRTQIYIALKIGVLDEKIGNEIIENTRIISAMLYSLIKTRMQKF